MNYLLLTLGHNSSAIFVDNRGDEQQIIGYEQERLSGIKADSQFPIDAINEIEHNVGYNAMKGCTIFISHWFNGSFDANKYITSKDMEKLFSYLPNNIKFTDKEFSHHDAHAYSAYAFYDNNRAAEKCKSLYCIVADGFGNDEEVFSIYCRRGLDEPELLHRAYGYNASLGLFYQYATSFVGMKENQDEYKFLGYEAHISDEFNDSEINRIKDKAVYIAYGLLDALENNTEPNIQNDNNTIDFKSLSKCKAYWNNAFKDIIESLCIKDQTSFKSRCAIAFAIQSVIETVINRIVQEYEMNNICVAGGCFYNVKLNNSILTHIKGIFCAMPLAGDQGAAIGMYVKYAAQNEKPFNFGTLCWGKRRMYNAEKLLSSIDDVLVVNSAEAEADEVISLVAQRIADGRIVNIVRGKMEFGPRALCNTSTLMLPSTANVAANNKMNNRNEVMPCAPVCTYKNACKLFDKDELFRVAGSDRYMICTHDYKKPFSEQYGGVMHYKTLSDGVYTGRPQIVSRDDIFMNKLLDKVEEICDAKCLVNTSFNAHGNPIVFDIMDIIRNYKYQHEHADENNKPILLVIL